MFLSILVGKGYFVFILFLSFSKREEITENCTRVYTVVVMVTVSLVVIELDF